MRRLCAVMICVLVGAPVLADEPIGPVTAGSMTLSTGAAPLISPRPLARPAWDFPALAWDGAPGATAWSRAALAALSGPARDLVDTVPGDIDAWCPAYRTADPAGRAAFWAGLVSTLAFYESTHDPRAVGGGGRWFGLVQISPATARGYGCVATSGNALLDGPANLQCGLRIMAETVPRDGVIARGMQGVAADWGPFHSTTKRE
ncbi:MAG: transglycosylase SLT domain-containing protein, partial [Pseudomonadota bacterium]